MYWNQATLGLGGGLSGGADIVFGRRGGGLVGGADKVVGPALVLETTSSSWIAPGPQYSFIGLHSSPSNAAYEMLQNTNSNHQKFHRELSQTKLGATSTDVSTPLCKVPPNLLIHYNL